MKRLVMTLALIGAVVCMLWGALRGRLDFRTSDQRDADRARDNLGNR